MKKQVEEDRAPMNVLLSSSYELLLKQLCTSQVGQKGLLHRVLAVSQSLYVLLPMALQSPDICVWLSSELVYAQRAYHLYDDEEAKTFHDLLQRVQSWLIEFPLVPAKKIPLLYLFEEAFPDFPKKLLFFEKHGGGVVSEAQAWDNLSLLFRRCEVINTVTDGASGLFDQYRQFHEMTYRLRKASAGKDMVEVFGALEAFGHYWFTLGEQLLENQDTQWDEALLNSALFYEAGLSLRVTHKSTFPNTAKICSTIQQKQLRLEAILLQGLNAQGIMTSPGEIFHRQHRQQLKSLRIAIKEKADILFETLPKDFEAWFKRGCDIRILNEKISSKMVNFIRSLFADAEQILGKPSCNYAVIGLGSLAKQACTPFSDCEFAILHEGFGAEADSYFLRLSRLFQYFVIRLGESPIPQNLIDYNVDHLVSPGFCVDLGGKIPTGRRYDAKTDNARFNTLKYCLVGNIAHFLSYLGDDVFAVDNLLPVSLATCCHLYGDEALTAAYQLALKGYWETTKREGILLGQCRALTLLRGNEYIQGDLSAYTPSTTLYDYTGVSYDVKQEIFRIPDRLIDDVALYYGIDGHKPLLGIPLWEKIEALVARQHFTSAQGQALLVMDAIARELRLRTYGYYGYQNQRIHLFRQRKEKDTDFHLQREGKATLALFYRIAFRFHDVLSQWCSEPEVASTLPITEFYATDDSAKGIFFEAVIAKRLFEPEKVILYGEQLLQKYSAIQTRELPREYLQMTYHYLAIYYRCRGDFEKATQCANSAYDFAVALAGSPQHIDTTFARMTMAYCLQTQGNYNDAESWLKETLMILRKNNGLKKQIAICYYRLGELYQEQGHFKKAERNLLRSLIYYDESGSENYPEAADITKSVGDFYRKIGDYNRAEAYLFKALSIEKSLYGSAAFPAIAHTYKCLASLYRDLGELEKGLTYVEKALEIEEHLQSESHPFAIANSYRIYGELLYRARGACKQAIEYAEKARAILDKGGVAWKIHPAMSIVLRNLGELYRVDGNYEAAKQCLEKALLIQRELYPTLNHPGCALVFKGLAELYKAQHEHQAAKEAIKKALRIEQQVHGENISHPGLARSLKLLADLYVAEKKFSKAETLLSQALLMEEALAQHHNKRGLHPGIPMTRKIIAKLRYRQGDFKETKAQLFAAIAMEEQLHSSKQHPSLAESYIRLADVFQRCGQQEKEEAKRHENFVEARNYLEKASAINHELHESQAVHSGLALNERIYARLCEAERNTNGAIYHYEHLIRIEKALHSDYYYVSLIKDLYRLSILYEKDNRRREAYLCLIDGISLQRKYYKDDVDSLHLQMLLKLCIGHDLSKEETSVQDFIEDIATWRDKTTRIISVMDEISYNLIMICYYQNNLLVKTLPFMNTLLAQLPLLEPENYRSISRSYFKALVIACKKIAKRYTREQTPDGNEVVLRLFEEVKNMCASYYGEQVDCVEKIKLYFDIGKMYEHSSIVRKISKAIDEILVAHQMLLRLKKQRSQQEIVFNYSYLEMEICAKLGKFYRWCKEYDLSQIFLDKAFGTIKDISSIAANKCRIAKISKAIAKVNLEDLEEERNGGFAFYNQDIHIRTRRITETKWLLEQALDIETRIDSENPRYLAECHQLLGKLYAIQENCGCARRHYEDALTLSLQQGDNFYVAQVHICLAEIYEKEFAFETAAAHYEIALQIYDEVNFFVTKPDKALVLFQKLYAAYYASGVLEKWDVYSQQYYNIQMQQVSRIRAAESAIPTAMHQGQRPLNSGFFQSRTYRPSEDAAREIIEAGEFHVRN